MVQIAEASQVLKGVFFELGILFLSYFEYLHFYFAIILLQLYFSYLSHTLWKAGPVDARMLR